MLQYTKSNSNAAGALRTIYRFTTFLCILMAAWTTALTFFHSELEKIPNNNFLPRDNVKKYNGQTIVMYAHVFPATFWSLCIPLQFHTGFRRKFPVIHRYIGRMFMVTSCVLMFGFGSIIYNKITFEHYANNTDETGALNDDPNPWVITHIPGIRYSLMDLTWCIPAVAFLYTGWIAVRYARQREFHQHQIWMIRHCSWGIWVMIQRVIIFIMSPIFMLWYGPDTPMSGRFRGWFFFLPALCAAIISVTIGEYCISLMDMMEGKKTKKCKGS